MKELRATDTIRIFYGFNPNRTGVLLVAGDKSGDKAFYKRMIPMADDLYDQYLAELAEEDGE